MHRIDSPGATQDNRFTEGNPVIPTPPTEVSDDWLNAVQEELAHVIEGAGVTLDKAKNDQLALAIAAMIATRKINTTWPLTGGGALDKDLTLEVKLATAAEVANRTGTGLVSSGQLAGLTLATIMGGLGVEGDSIFMRSGEPVWGHAVPMPQTANPSALGYIVTYSLTDGQAVVVPSGGTWFLFLLQYEGGGKVYSHQPARVVAGGYSITPQTGYKYNGLAWRIA